MEQNAKHVALWAMNYSFWQQEVQKFKITAVKSRSNSKPFWCVASESVRRKHREKKRDREARRKSRGTPMAETAIDEQKQLSHRIAKIFDESRSSYATHNRKLKELSNLRSSSPQHFFFSLCRALSPIFTFQRRTASAERVIRFVSIFASAKSSAGDDVFLEDFLRFLLSGTTAAAKTARFRSCQIISEVQLPFF